MSDFSHDVEATFLAAAPALTDPDYEEWFVAETERQEAMYKQEAGDAKLAKRLSSSQAEPMPPQDP